MTKALHPPMLTGHAGFTLLGELSELPTTYAVPNEALHPQGRASYHVTADARLVVRLRVVHAPEVTLEVALVQPKNGRISVSLVWGADRKVKLSQNGRHSLTYDIPSSASSNP